MIENEKREANLWPSIKEGFRFPFVMDQIKFKVFIIFFSFMTILRSFELTKFDFLRWLFVIFLMMLGGTYVGRSTFEGSTDQPFFRTFLTKRFWLLTSALVSLALFTIYIVGRLHTVGDVMRHLICYYIIVRFSLIFPHIVAGYTPDMRASWHMSAYNAAKIALLIVCFWVSYYLSYKFLMYFQNALSVFFGFSVNALEQGGGLVISIAFEALFIIYLWFTLGGAAAITHFYKQLRENVS